MLVGQQAEHRARHRARCGGVARVACNGGVEIGFCAIEACFHVAQRTQPAGQSCRAALQAQQQIGGGVVAHDHSRLAECAHGHAFGIGVFFGDGGIRDQFFFLVEHGLLERELAELREMQDARREQRLEGAAHGEQLIFAVREGAVAAQNLYRQAQSTAGAGLQRGQALLPVVALGFACATEPGVLLHHPAAPGQSQCGRAIGGCQQQIAPLHIFPHLTSHQIESNGPHGPKPEQNNPGHAMRAGVV